MAKYTFICEEEYGTPAKRTVEFEADSLNDILNEFEMFLRGSGFYFRGTLDVVNDSDYEDTESDWNIPREDVQFDFSEIPQNNWPFGKVKPQEEESSVYVSDDIELNVFNQGAAQPALHLYDEMNYGPAITIPKSSR